MTSSADLIAGRRRVILRNAAVAAACLFAGFSHTLRAQTFRWQASVEQVPADGYYRVLLPPGVTSQLSPGFPDVRLYDRDSLETPYLVAKDEAHRGVDRFVSYEIVDRELKRGCCSHITVKNPAGTPIDHLVLEVNNADASRRMTLSGSYDGQSWFTVRDQFTVSSFDTYEKGEQRTTSLLRFDFPLTDYQFYRFEFDDWRWWWSGEADRDPVFIVRAGYTEPTFIPEECLELPEPSVVQSDSLDAKKSFIRISFADSQYVDHLRFSFHTKKPGKDYYRAAVLYEMIPAQKLNRYRPQQQYLASTLLSSTNPNEISPGPRRVKELLLVIDNEDNLPLILDSVNAFQVKHYLLAELEKDNRYVLLFGNDSLVRPAYELRYFRSKIPENAPVISAGERLDISGKGISPATMKGLTAKKKTEVTGPLLRDRRFIWLAIGGVILLLGFMTMRMLREMK